MKFNMLRKLARGAAQVANLRYSRLTVGATCMAVCLGVWTLLAPGSARAGQWDTGTFTLPAGLSSPPTNGIVTTNGASAYYFTPGSSLSLAVSAQSASAETLMMTNGFDLYNGTVWTTTSPIKMVTTMAGTTNVVNATNIPAATLAGYQAIRPGSVGAPVDIVQQTINSISYASFH